MSNLNTGNIIDPRNPDATRSPAWFVARAWERGELLSASMQAEAQKYFDAALANNDGASMNDRLFVEELYLWNVRRQSV